MDNNIVKEAKFVKRTDGAYDLQVTMDADAYLQICEILKLIGITIEEAIVRFLKELAKGNCTGVLKDEYDIEE